MSDKTYLDVRRQKLESVVGGQPEMIKNYLNPILASIDDSNPYLNNLSVSTSRIVHSKKVLRIPEIQTTDVEFDTVKNQITLKLDDPDPDSASMVDSATSITGLKNKVFTLKQFKNFVHDFTFGILVESTDSELQNHFPSMDDSYDKKSPDMILSSPDAIIVAEFATNRSNQDSSLRTDYDKKMFTYEEAIRRRITKLKQDPSQDKYYAYFVIVVSETKVAYSSFIKLSPQLVDELCARFRFATNVMRQAEENGFKSGDETTTQLEIDAINQFGSIHYDEKIHLIPGAKISFTKERLDTSMISERDAHLYMRDMYNRSLQKAILELEKPEPIKTDDQWEQDIASAVRAKIVGTRLDKKSILQLPGYLPPYYTGTYVPKRERVSGCLNEFWDECINIMNSEAWNYEKGVDIMLAEALKPPKRAKYEQTEEEIERKKRRKLYKRASIPLTVDQRIEFAKVGVQGKDLRNHPEVKAYRERTHEGFGYDVETQDVDDFLSKPLTYTKDTFLPALLPNTLIEDALSMHKFNVREHMEFIELIMSTKLFRWCSFISDIANELAISLRQNVKKDQFVLKKLKNYKCHIVLKPTDSTSHIFYSILMPTESEQVVPPPVSKKPSNRSSSLMFDWVSVTETKLANMLTAESTCMSMFAQWYRHYGSQSIRDEKFAANVERMTKLSMLIHLEDKHATEEVMTLMRYISMEKFSMLKQNRMKMVDKIPTIIRSRLTMWCTKKMVTLMSQPLYKPVREGEKIVKWENMYNPYVNEPVESVQQLLEYYYIGYATNKDAKSWENNDFSLVNKIVKYEDELKKADARHCGIEERPDGEEYRFHEWSRKAVCFSADAIKRHLNKLNPGCWEKKLQEAIIHRLSRLTWDYLATLKASSTYDPHERRDFVKNADGNVKYHMKRRKALEAIIEIKDMLNQTPVASIKSILEWVEKDGGLRVDIFKKNQHGGTREIYVLDIRSRIIQLIVEELVKAICDLLPVEMMTHSKDKIRRPQEHIYNSAIRPEKYRVNVSSANDAKVWNQGHPSSKFCQFLLRLVPPLFHGFLTRALQLWTKKRIALPDGVMNAMHKADRMMKSDPIDQLIYDSWIGNKESPWLAKHGEHLLIETGMMQGILHYTSSLFHCGLVMGRDELWQEFSIPRHIKSITDDMVSSDDSSRQTEILSNDKEELRTHMIIAICDHMIITIYSNLHGIFMSAKSSFPLSRIMEFNSEWFIGASLYRPTIKWALAAMDILEVESLVERQEVMYTQITQLLEGGSGFFQASIAQYAQALLHYRLLGSSTNPLFPSFMHKVMILRDPSLGYFLMDNPFAAGLPGFSYNLWNCMTLTPYLASLYANLLKSTSLTTTTTGLLTRGAQIRFGNRRKVLKLIETLDTMVPGWKEEVESNPEVLYSFADHLHQALLKIMVKVTSPSVIKSLAKGSSLSRMMASGVYLISETVISVGSNWIQRLTEGTELEGSPKYSLMYILSDRIDDTEKLSPDQMLAIFPHHDQFSRMRNMLNTISTYKLKPGGSKKMLRTHIQVYFQNPQLVYDLETMVKWRWFGQKISAADYMLKDIWRLYVRLYPWLRDTAQETLSSEDNPGLETQIQLRNFIARQSDKGRQVHLTGAPLRDSSNNDMLLMAILKNQRPGWTLVSGELRTIEPTDYLQVQSDVAKIVQFPFNKEEKIDRLTKCLRDQDRLWDGESWNVPERRINLHIIKQYLTHKMTRYGLEMATLRNMIRKSRNGIIGGFTRPQRYTDGVWKGLGTWLGSIGKVTIQVLVYDQSLLHITTSDSAALRGLEEQLSKLMMDLGLTTYHTGKVPHGYTYPNRSAIKSRFDLKVFNTFAGAPVTESSNLHAAHEIDLSTVEIEFTENAIKLVQPIADLESVSETDKKSQVVKSDIDMDWRRRDEPKDQKMSRYTVLRYHVRSSDYNFNTTMDDKNQLFKAWINNTPVEAVTAEKILENLRDDKKTDYKHLVREKIISFTKASLLPSLTRMGWIFSTELLRKELPDVEDIPIDYEAYEYDPFDDKFDWDSHARFVANCFVPNKSNQLDVSAKPSSGTIGSMTPTPMDIIVTNEEEVMDIEVLDDAESRDGSEGEEEEEDDDSEMVILEMSDFSDEDRSETSSKHKGTNLDIMWGDTSPNRVRSRSSRETVGDEETPRCSPYESTTLYFDDIVYMIDPADLEEVLLDERTLEDSTNRAGDIRRYHKIWDDYSKKTYNAYSSYHKQKISERQMTSDKFGFVSNLVYFYNWKFTARAEPSPESSVPPMDTIL